MNAVQKFGAAVVAAGAISTGVLMAKWEPARDPTVSYFDKIGSAWTICYGHTKGVHAGMRVSMEQCNAWRRADIAEAQGTIALCIDYPLTSNQLGALGSGVVNLGPKLVCGSTLQRKANAGDMQGACRELTDALNTDGQRRGWSFGGGKFLQGLFNRRVDELDVCWPNFGNVESGAAWAS